MRYHPDLRDAFGGRSKMDLLLIRGDRTDIFAESLRAILFGPGLPSFVLWDLVEFPYFFWVGLVYVFVFGKNF